MSCVGKGYFLYIFPNEFLILDHKVDFDVPILLGYPFLVMGKVLVDMDMGYIKFKLND